MRFYLDEHLSPSIAQAARTLGLDVTSAAELGRLELPDESQLDLAAQEGRCLVSADRDFVDRTRDFFEAQRPHAGVLLVPGSWNTNEYSRIARAMFAYAELRGDAPTSYLCDFLR